MLSEERFSKKIWLWLLGVDILLRHFFKLCPIPSEKAREAAIGLIKVTECYGAIYTVSKLKIKKKKKSTQSILEKKITFIRKQSTKKTTTMTTWIIPGRLWSSEIRHPRRWGDWASWACPSLRRRCYPEVTSSRMG